MCVCVCVCVCVHMQMDVLVSTVKALQAGNVLCLYFVMAIQPNKQEDTVENYTVLSHTTL